MRRTYISSCTPEEHYSSVKGLFGPNALTLRAPSTWQQMLLIVLTYVASRSLHPKTDVLLEYGLNFSRFFHFMLYTVTLSFKSQTCLARAVMLLLSGMLKEDQCCAIRQDRCASNTVPDFLHQLFTHLSISQFAGFISLH